MIPIVAITNAISFLVCLFAFLKLNRSYRSSRKENEFVGHFTMFYLFMAIFFFLAAMPGIFFEADIFTIYVIAISNVALYMATLFFIIIPLKIWNVILIKKSVIGIILISLLTTLLLNIMDPGTAVYRYIGNSYYVVVIQNSFAKISLGIITTVSAILGSLFFIINGLTLSLNIHAKIRSLLIGSGMIFLIAASIVNFIIFNFTSSVYTLLISSTFAVFGLIIMFIGILIKTKT